MTGSRKRFRACVLISSLTVSALYAQGVPQELRGRWKITKALPTRAISCWGDKEAKAILGTEIECTSPTFRWNRTTFKNFKVTRRIVTKQQYHEEFRSGQQPLGSDVPTAWFQGCWVSLSLRSTSSPGITVVAPNFRGSMLDGY